MSRHTFIDNVVAGLGGLYGNSMKFFSEGIQSPPLPRLIRQLEADAPSPNGAGERTARLRFVSPAELPIADTLETHARVTSTPVTDAPDSGSAPTAMRDGLEVDYRVLAWIGPTAPTLIFHHGSGDHPYHARLRRILGRTARDDIPRASQGINLIATNSPFNHDKREYLRAIRDLGRFTLLLAGSVALVQRLVTGLRQAATRAAATRGVGAPMPKIVVAGISLGGWVTNLHHSFYDSADEYRPIFAGAALDALFTESAYRRLTARAAREAPDHLRRVLNFEPAFRRRSGHKVHALLARHDRYVQLQRQGDIYRPDRLQVMEKGHITGAADNVALRTFLLDAFCSSEGSAAA